MSNKLEDYGKSLELAQEIEMIKSVVMTMDLGYLETCRNAFEDQAGWQDSAAVLSPTYSPTKSDLLRVQAKTMNHLLNLAEGLKKCQELKDKIAMEDSTRSEIMKMFW